MSEERKEKLAEGQPEAGKDLQAELEREKQQLEAELEQLKEQLAEAEKQAKENWEKFLRAAAELDNFRKRTAREVELAQKSALERFVREILVVADSLELGLQAASETDQIEKVREGIELTLKQLMTLFHKFKIKQLDPLGEPFDPHFHEAMAMEEVEGVEPGTVVRVIQKGYLLEDRLVRPALVVVAKAPSEKKEL